MKFEYFSLFLLLKLYRVVCYFSITYHDYLENSAYPLHQVPDGGYCDFEPTCFCIWNIEKFDFHCEKDVHLEMQHIREGLASIIIQCYNKSSEKYLKYDFSHMLLLDGFEKLSLTFKECSAPNKPYASYVFPPSEYSSTTQQKTERSLPFISTLNIDCGSRTEFSLNKEHLNGLNLLNKLVIKCNALFDLPSDIFQGNLPELQELHIVYTRMEYIPKMLFHSLKKLVLLNIEDNRIKKIQKEDFKGIESLKVLFIGFNQLDNLEEDIFDAVKSLNNLQINDNRLNVLPLSFSSMTDLRVLSLSNNYLAQIRESDCKGLGSLSTLTLTKNKIVHIDPQCFSYMKKIKVLDLSGNFLEELPERPTAMENLQYFIFNDNAITSKLNLNQFLVSDVLDELVMRNSCIESLSQDFIHGLPNLEVVHLNLNSISFIHEDFFKLNPKLREINLKGNEISSLSPNLFRRNPSLQSLSISSNKLTHIPVAIFENNENLDLLDLSNNFITELSVNFSLGLRSITTLMLSNNSIASLEKEFFTGMNKLKSLDFSYNRIENLAKDVFSPFKANGPLNPFSNLGYHEPYLSATDLKYMNLSGNKITSMSHGVFHYLHNLEILNLSHNELSFLPNSPLITKDQKLHHLDLSYNQLSHIPEETLSEMQNLVSLDLSRNKLTQFFLRWIYNSISLREINLSNNDMYFFGNERGDRIPIKISYGSLKVLNLSNNKLSFNHSSWLYDERKKTWGRISPLIQLTKIEEIHLYNNSIKTIFMDWRNELSHLRLLDLRRNVFTYLTHQELLFSTVTEYVNDTVVPYACSHSLKVDLRENQIKVVELPHSMLKVLKRTNQTQGIYSHATILLDDNPYVCGCRVLDFLRLLSNDVVLTSELQRVDGKDWVLPAWIEVGNLSCWEPMFVRGKKLMEPETWSHHFLPLFGLCSLDESWP